MINTPPYDGMAGDPNSYIAWIAETKEGRFDTNLMEEKFTEPNEWFTFLKEGEELDLAYTWEVGEEIPDWFFWEWNFWHVGGEIWPLDDFEHLGVWRADAPFADCDGDGLLTPYDVHAYVNGVEVPVLAVYNDGGWWGVNGYAILDTAAYLYEGPGWWDLVDVTADYCHWEMVYDEYWRWINIETRPWDYTEFILPMRPDVTDPLDEDGDYILVGSWLTEDSIEVRSA
jgi:hypothetical protein